jgi:hypothetical protein
MPVFIQFHIANLSSLLSKELFEDVIKINIGSLYAFYGAVNPSFRLS